MIDRLIAMEAAYTEARAGVIAAREGNPYGAATRRDSAAFAVQVAGVPSPWLNRASGLGDPALVPVLAEWFGPIAWRAETWADRCTAPLSATLIAAGKRPNGGDSVVCGRPMTRTRTTVEDADIDLFIETHLAGLGIPHDVQPLAKANMRGWQALSGWHFLLARRDGAPAGTCVLFLQEDLAYLADMATVPAFRQRGVQTELLAECHRRAAGCSAIWARCRFGSQSHRNLTRAALATLCTTIFWG